MTNELSIFRESFPIKLMMKLCIDNNVRMFNTIQSDILTFTEESRRIYEILAHRLSVDDCLPTVEALRDIGIEFDANEITGTLNHYYEETLSAYRVIKIAPLLAESVNDITNEQFAELEEKLNTCKLHLTRGSVQRHLIAQSLTDVVEEVIQNSSQAYLSNNRGIVTTGYEELDEIIYGGWMPGNLYTITGRMKQGKTSYLLHMATRAWLSNKRILILSGEMTVDEMATKIISQYTHIEPRDIIRGEITTQGRTEMREFAELSSEADFYLKPITEGSTVEDIEIAVKEFEPDILYVDSAHLIYAKRYGDRWEPKDHEKVKKTVNALKKLALVNNIPVVTTTHLNREAEARRRSRRSSIEVPEMKAIAGSDEWGKTASIIFAILPTSNEEQKVLHMMAARATRNQDFLLNFKPSVPVNYSLISLFDVEEQNQNHQIERNQRTEMMRTQAMNTSQEFDWLQELEDNE